MFVFTLPIRPLFFVLLFLAALGAAAPAPASGDFPSLVLAGAREQILKAPRYSGEYVRLKYPGGDPGEERGACVDLVIRSYRRAGVDLQKLVHEDVLQAPSVYGMERPDRSIDHRRTRNLLVFFRRHAESLTKKISPETTPQWQGGDVIVWNITPKTRPGYPDHIGLVSDRRNGQGVPLVLHHAVPPFSAGDVPEEADALEKWPVLGHFRWKAP
jgi:hypothetical protein